MRKVFYKKWIPQLWVHQNGQETLTRMPFEGENVSGVQQKAGTGKYQDDYLTEGIFHRWGDEIEEDDRGKYNNSFGIVELPDGTIEQVGPDKIKFVPEKPVNRDIHPFVPIKFTVDGTECATIQAEITNEEICKLRFGKVINLQPMTVKYNDKEKSGYLKPGEKIAVSEGMEFLFNFGTN
jgi:hypothetical protein